MTVPITARIYWSGSEYIDVPCSRWDEDNYTMKFEFFCEGSSQRNTIFDNCVPGAVRELYNILGTPKYIDTTYESRNTFVINPLDGYGLSSLREGRTVAIKSISDSIFGMNHFCVTLDCVRLDIE